MALILLGAISSSCSTLHSAVYGSEIDKDAQFVEQKRSLLQCNMSVAQAEQIIGEPLIASDAPSQKWVRRLHHGFADLILTFEEDKLRSTQMIVSTGIMSGAAKPQRSVCS
jgi:hypothetical protein